MNPIKPLGAQSVAQLIFEWLRSEWGAPVALFCTGFALMLIAGSPLIRWLKGLRGMKWSPREDTPESHMAKAGTPSMGGIGIIGAALLAWVAFVTLYSGMGALANDRSPLSFRPGDLTFLAILFVFPGFVLLHALLGFADDWSKARGTGGLRARTKILWQIALAFGFVLSFAVWATHSNMGPLARNYGLAAERFSISPSFLGLLAFAMLVIIAAGNAVNLTDGIDGLAAGLSVQCGLILCVLGSFETGSNFGALTLFWAALAGACLGFLAFNRYPAKVFMGDTGSLALGAALGIGGLLCHAVFLLPFIGFIFWVETLSVTLQVAYFKWTKRKTGEGQRLFRRAPLHHHFELSGWSEWRVVGTFWLVNLVVSLIGLVLWHLQIIPRWP